MTCTHCHAANKPGSHFCKQCGARLATASRKRNRVVATRRATSWWKFPAGFGGVALLVIVFAVMSRSPASNPRMLAQPLVTEKTDYGDGIIPMSPIESTVQDGRITIPVQAVKEKKLVRFEHNDGSRSLPLLAYLTPSGRLVTAVSVCEPCESTRFHIEGKTIVCDKCGSRWDLETLSGLSGGCLSYPPDFIPSVVQGGTIQIDEARVKQWTPRA